MISARTIAVFRLSPARSVTLAAGILVLVIAWAGPLPALAMTRFAAHMTMHLAVVAIAAPLIALAIAGSRLDPTARAVQTGAGVLAFPVLAAFAEFAVVWGAHVPAVHDMKRLEPTWAAIEQLAFLAVGVALWLSAFGGRGRERGARAALGIGALLFTAMHMTLLGALLALAPRPLYEACLGLADQEIGGVMMLAAGLVYLVGGVVLVGRILGDGEDPSP